MGDGGLLIQGHETADWSAGLESLLDDTDRRMLLSRNALQHASLFSWGATTDRLLEVYSEATAARTAPPAVESDVPHLSIVPDIVTL